MIPGFRDIFLKSFWPRTCWSIFLALKHSALLDFSDYLVMGGKMIIQTSSILHVAAKLQQASRYAEHHGWTICLFGNQAHPGDFHHTGFTELTLKVHLLAAGFKIDRLEMRDDWMFYLESKKVFDWTSLLDQPNLGDQQFLEAAYQQAFFRDIDQTGLAHFTNAFLGGADRKFALKQIFSAPERLSRIADHNGL
jgi:Domain of unknown function (DUF4214)